ncbi:uncharacterized protein LOC106668453 isoform X3 [Cimex lectularius]|nr:uncharacterized protein LOC106668453 isoform X3 [Cimex lectularius]XP_014252725.1 uncharacterized protein LOC106668453 isoform X3 [Cimex lectularius]
MLHPRRLRPPLPDTRAHKQEQGLVIKPSNIRIWIHDKDLGRLQRVLWEGMGDRLRTETSTQPMVRRFLNAVPYIMGSIREVHTAAVNNDLELLLARSAEPVPKDILMSKDANGLTPLHKAAGLGNMEIVQEILRRAPEAVNAKDNIGRTPLHYAAGLRDRNAMYQHLVDAGAIDHLEDKKGNTPSHYKGKPSELEGPQYLSVIPNAPRTAHIFPPSWDWRLLTTSSDAETASTATSPQIETIRNINDEKITKEEEELAPKIDDDEEMEQASETPEVESEPVLDPETAQSEPAEAEAMRPEMSEDEGVGSEFPASAGDTLSPESDVTNEEDVREDELSGAKLGETFTLTRSLFGGRGHRGGNLGDYDSGNEDVQTESEETFGEKINHDFVEDVGELNESDQIGILELNERRNESSSSLASQNNEIEDIFKRPTSGQRESISRPISGTNIKMSDEGENSRPSSRQIEGSPSDSIREQMGGRSNIPLNGQMEGRSRRTTRGSNSISLINGPTTGQIARTSSRPTGGQMEGSSNGSTSGELVEGISGTPFRERMNSSRPSSGQIDERSSILIRGQSERDSDRLGSAEGSSSEPINGQVEDSSNIPISEQMESSTDRPTSGQMEGSGPFSGRMENSSSRPISGQMEGRSSRPISGQMENSSSRPISGQMEGRSSRPISGQFEGRSSRPISGQLDRRSSRTVDGEMEGRSSRPISGSTEGSSSSPISGQFESNSSRPTSGQIGRSSGPINAQFEGTSSRLISGQINSSSSRPVSGQMDSSLNRPFSGMMEDSTNGAPLDQRGMNDTNREGSSQSRETSRPTSTTMNSDESRPSSTINQKESSDVVNDNDNDESEDQDSLNQNTEMISRQIDNSTESNPNTETESRPSISGQSSRPGTGPFQANGSRSAQGDSGSEEEAETPERVLTAGGSRAEILAITPAPPEVGEDSDTQKAVEEQISEEEKQLAEELVKTGDMEAMAEMVLAGQGSALLGLTSDNPDVQLFINNVPQYMAKIERVHKAAREGDLRGVQTSLDRRKFAVARDNSTPLKPTPLHVAALFGRTSVLRYLAGRFPETMHAQDSAGRSPLHYAATLPDNGHFYSLLVTLGADKSLADDAGKTAEDYLRNRAELTRESLLAEYQNRTVPVDTSGLNFNRYADKVANDNVSSRQDIDDELLMARLETAFHFVQTKGKGTFLQKHCTKAVFEELKYRCTRLDNTLIDVIRPGVRDLALGKGKLKDKLFTGLEVPDYESFRVFERIIMPVIRELNEISPGEELREQPARNFWSERKEQFETIDLDPTGNVIKGFVVEMSRNLSPVSFPKNLKLSDLEKVEVALTSVMTGYYRRNKESGFIDESGENFGSYYSLNEMAENKEVLQDLEQESLVAEGIDDPNSDNWPYGRGVFISPYGDVAAWINIREHLKLFTVTTPEHRGHAGRAYITAVDIISSLDEKVESVRDPVLGFLTTDPRLVGNTLCFNVLLSLPNLAKSKSSLNRLCVEQGLHLQMTTNPTRFRLKNKACLGYSEFDCFFKFVDSVKMIVEAEKFSSKTSVVQIPSLIKNFLAKKNRRKLDN